MGCGGRSSSRSPHPWRMKFEYAVGTEGSCDSVFSSFSSLTGLTLRRRPGRFVRLPAMPGKRRDTIAFTVVVTVLVVLGGAGMLLILALSGAPGTMLLATVLATVPVGPLVACYLWLDRYEPEPRRLLAAGLLWGGFVATAVAIVLQCIGGFFVGLRAVT